MEKKYTSILLQIPEPCQQSWEEMTPLPGGRFCRRCEKTVVDFTQMTDREIARFYLRRQGRVCGQFRQDQLNKNLPLPEPISRWQKFRAIGALVSGLLLSGAAAAQKAVQTPLTIVQPASEKSKLRPVSTASLLLKGAVVDEAGKPLIGASIALAADNPKHPLIGTISLEDGRFELEIPEEARQFHLEFSYIGYETQVLEFDTAEINEEIEVEVKMKVASYALESVEVIAYKAPFVKMGVVSGGAVMYKGEKEREKELRPNAEEIDVFGVFPNPFTSFINIELDLTEPGRLLFHLYDASGKLVFAQTEELPKGRQLLPLDFSGRHLPAGAYFLRVSDEVGEIRTKPLVKVD